MKSLIDVHVHLAAFPNGSNGCYMSPAFQKGSLVKLVRFKLGLRGDTPDQINQSYVDKLIRDLDASTRVNKAVLLALDGVYDQSGKLNETKTHMMIGNDYVKSLVDLYPDKFIFGASVNPRRRDALDELARVAEKGAKLIKVLPPSQVFDPMDHRYRDYYRTLAKHRIPMLSHIGYEYSVTAGKQEYGQPDRLKFALDEGVIVIGAHACSSAVFKGGNFTKDLEELVKIYPHFYMDLSATTLPNRAYILYYLRRHPQLFDRLLFGSDYPLSVYSTPILGQVSLKEQWKLWRTKNIFDKQAAVLEAMKIGFNNGLSERLLNVH